ncbi:seminase [Drosophila innubila]|uniref:seminase n=1 Tax=Drosophila innubila TaxID=198719 RepID=UPI00148C3113|nr:seminase [Drosophila innubila]
MGGWLLRIVNGNGHFACCGAYVAPLVVITSGNCMEPYRNNLNGAEVEAIAMLKDEENYASIETVYTPETFKENHNLMDIAVVKLRAPIKGKMTEFIKLCDTDINDKMTMTSFGWGYSSFSLQDPSNIPRNFTVPVQNIRDCKKEWLKYGQDKISDTVFCVSHPTQDRRQCVYDPGCPLIWNNELCGIVSIDSSCVDPSKPGIYTNINHVKEFILRVSANVKLG